MARIEIEKNLHKNILFEPVENLLMAKSTRRDLFLKWGPAAGAALGAVILGGCVPEAEQQPQPQSETELIPMQCGEFAIPPEVQEPAKIMFQEGYKHWRNSAFVTDEGLPEGQLRVLYTGDNDTSMEYMATGMIMAVHAGDKNTFEELWTYTQAHLNQDGLPSWRIAADGNPIDKNSASDSSQDTAYALYIAGKKWENESYTTAARTMANNILAHEVESGTNIIKGGNAWGGSDETNLSYYNPGYYEIFGELTEDPRWKDVAKACREVFDKAFAKGNKLPPNRTTADGGTVPSRGAEGETYGYEASRVAFRQAFGALAFCDRPEVATHAISILRKINMFYENNDVDPGWDGYNPVTMEKTGQYGDNPVFFGAAAVAAGTSENSNRVEELRTKMNVKNSFVHNSTWGTLYALMLSGQMMK